MLSHVYDGNNENITASWKTPSFGCRSDGGARFQSCELGSSCCARSERLHELVLLNNLCNIRKWRYVSLLFLFFFSFFHTSRNLLFTRFCSERKSNKLLQKKNKTTSARLQVGRKGKRTVLLGNTLDEGHKFCCVYEEPLVAPTRTQTLKAAQTKACVPPPPRAFRLFSHRFHPIFCSWTFRRVSKKRSREESVQTFVRIRWTTMSDQFLHFVWEADKLKKKKSKSQNVKEKKRSIRPFQFGCHWKDSQLN